MAANTPTPTTTTLTPSVELFLADVRRRFVPNRYGQLDDKDFLEVFELAAQVFADWRHLSVKRVKGAPYPVPYTDNLGLIPPEYRILGMQAQAVNGVDSATGAAGVRADPVYYTLLRDSAGPVDALLDSEPTTVLTVKARWVLASGSAAQRINSFDELVLQDYEYAAGDVRRYTFPDGHTALVQWKADSVDFQHPAPTGDEDDPIYRLFAPPDTGFGAALSEAQQQQLAVASAAVKVTKDDQAARGYEKLEEAVAAIRRDFNHLLGWTFTIQRTLTVTGQVYLDHAKSLVSQECTVLVAAGGALRIAPNVQLNGVAVVGLPESRNLPAGYVNVEALRVHNSTLSGQPRTPMLISYDTRLTDSSINFVVVTGILRLGPGAQMDLSAYTPQPGNPNAYDTPAGGVIYDERGGTGTSAGTDPDALPAPLVAGQRTVTTDFVLDAVPKLAHDAGFKAQDASAGARNHLRGNWQLLANGADADYLAFAQSDGYAIVRMDLLEQYVKNAIDSVKSAAYLTVDFPTGGAQTSTIHIGHAHQVGTVSLYTTTGGITNLTYALNGAQVSLPQRVVLTNTITVSATMPAGGGSVVLLVSP